MSTVITESPTFQVDDLKNESISEAPMDAPTDEALDGSVANGDGSASPESPEVTPPGEAASAVDDGGVAAAVWHRNVRITATWSNASARNAYAAVSGLGWRRISAANDSSFVTMTAMLAHAEATEKRTDVKLDNNVIVETYVF